ncbi:MAG: adenylosuccinate lyase [Candidatus Eisenbacteria bacterium]|nr:adenylosuccinate lyase [Candidatus Eisenbacteria bacterium]
MIERYTRPEMGALWSDDRKFSTWLEVETVVCEEGEKLGLCPPGTGRKVREGARFDAGRIAEIEGRVHHDVIAFLTNVCEHLGDESRFFHFGLTSSDLLDTSLGVLCGQACGIVQRELGTLCDVLRGLALEHRNTTMVGRTHGMHAEPITFGLKMLVWYEETRRNLARTEAAREAVSAGKLSGVVGTFSHVPPELEERVCARLGLRPEPAATQVVQRDRHAELLSALAITAASLEKFATEIRHLQRTEVGEAAEGFGQEQKGSSAMPHKRNPILCERICGLSRVVRANALAATENVALWHERDISHSSVERIIIPDSFILVDYMLGTFITMLRTLEVRPARMKENLEWSKDAIFSQRVMLELTRRGMRRDEAYGLVQSLAKEAWAGGSFREAAMRDEKLAGLLDRATLEECFDLDYLLRHVDSVYKRVLGS